MTPSNKNPLRSGSTREISLSGHCTGKSAVTPSKHGSMRTIKARNVLECARRPCWNSEHRHNMGRVYILRKCLVRAMSPKSRCRGGVAPLCGNIHSYYIQFTQHVPRVSRSTILSKNVKSPKDGSNPKLPYKGSSRGGRIELL